MKCITCGEPIVLVPSVNERAEKYGGSPDSYQKLFMEHSRCLIRRRDEEVRKVMRQTKPYSSSWVTIGKLS